MTPTPRATLDVPVAGGAPIRVRLHGEARPVRLFVSHGNGFAADGYAAFWRRFLPEFEIAVFDMRNHGHNERGDPALHDYAHMAADVDAVCRAVAAEFGAKPSAGLFHSMSAQSAMLAAVRLGLRLDALVAFDPPNMPPDGPAREAMLGYLHRLTRWARNRRDSFTEPADLAREYGATRSGREWGADTHEAMACAVLRQEVGAWRLACPRELEASMYEQGEPLDLWPRRGDFAGTVMLISADPTRERPSPTALSNRALAEAGGIAYIAIPGTSHLLQLEKPEACAEAALAFLTATGLAR